MADREIERTDKVLAQIASEPVEIPADLTIADFCLDSIKKMLTQGNAPASSFHVLHGGSVYYIDIMVRAIAPPFKSRDPSLDEKQWFGQRES